MCEKAGENSFFVEDDASLGEKKITISCILYSMKGDSEETEGGREGDTEGEIETRTQKYGTNIVVKVNDATLS